MAHNFNVSGLALRYQNRLLWMISILILTFAAHSVRADSSVAEGFEDSIFKGPSTPLGSYGGWKTSGTAVVVNDPHAYDGKNLLRLMDTADSSQSSASKNLVGLKLSANGTGSGLTISFALREAADGSSLNNNDQVIVYGTGNYPAFQCGIKANDSGVVFSYTPYNGGIAGTTVVLAPPGDFAISANTWYLFTVTYSVKEDSLAGTYSLSITEGKKVVGKFDNLAGQANFGSAANEVLRKFIVQTSNAGQGNVDIDGISITPSKADSPK